jgi:hypothetical protein
MDKKSIFGLIEKAGSKAFFVGKADDKKIAEIEQLLGITLPESYKWFLREFGHGGIPGLEIYGNGLAKISSCVHYTTEWREFGLQEHFVVVEDVDEWLYCLDTSRLCNGECPVVDWVQGEGIGQEYYETFFIFFEKQIKEYLEYL